MATEHHACSDAILVSPHAHLLGVASPTVTYCLFRAAEGVHPDLGYPGPEGAADGGSIVCSYSHNQEAPTPHLLPTLIFQCFTLWCKRDIWDHMLLLTPRYFWSRSVIIVRKISIDINYLCNEKMPFSCLPLHYLILSLRKKFGWGNNTLWLP